MNAPATAPTATGPDSAPATGPGPGPGTGTGGPVERAINERLVAALSPSVLRVVNESAQHRGHMGDDGSGESHFRVVVESDAFAGQSRVACQRLVNHALADLLAGQIHALAIEARAPASAR